MNKVHTSIVDVLWGQPIKLIKVTSNLELSENKWNDLLFFKLFPLIASGPQKPKKLIASKIKYESLGPKILIPH